MTPYQKHKKETLDFLELRIAELDSAAERLVDETQAAKERLSQVVSDREQIVKEIDELQVTVRALKAARLSAFLAGETDYSER